MTPHRRGVRPYGGGSHGGERRSHHRTLSHYMHLYAYGW
ncbi:hypothetical protein GZL_07123 [Streptomyces sp. 769]|nr:hypothetical protein GZL_07123 [Streptomyces sp. 769]